VAKPNYGNGLFDLCVQNRDDKTTTLIDSFLASFAFCAAIATRNMAVRFHCEAEEEEKQDNSQSDSSKKFYLSLSNKYIQLNNIMYNMSSKYI
jgi:hypothetical protein